LVKKRIFRTFLKFVRILYCLSVKSEIRWRLDANRLLFYNCVCYMFAGHIKLKEDLLQLGGNPDINHSWPLVVSPTIEFGDRCHVCTTATYVFMCGKELRRDMFEWHVKNVHTEIMSGLNGWLNEKCPLERINCEFFRPRLYPDIPTAAVTFNAELDSFALTYETLHDVHGKKEVETTITICELPCEVLELICNFLDPLR
jgi:hypothetical protein